MRGSRKLLAIAGAVTALSLGAAACGDDDDDDGGGGEDTSSASFELKLSPLSMIVPLESVSVRSRSVVEPPAIDTSTCASADTSIWNQSSSSPLVAAGWQTEGDVVPSRHAENAKG